MSWCINDCLQIKKYCNIKCKGVDFWCNLWRINKNEAAIILHNSVLEDKVFLKMDFGANKTPEGAFGGTYFRDIYFGVNGKWYRKSWKEFDQLKILIRSIIA